MVVGVCVVVTVMVRRILGAVCAVHALYAMGALAVAVTTALGGIMWVFENVLRKGSRDWRQSVARTLSQVALERRLHRRAYRRLWSSERVCPCVPALAQAIRVELVRLFKVEAAVECLRRCCLVVVERAVVQCPRGTVRHREWPPVRHTVSVVRQDAAAAVYRSSFEKLSLVYCAVMSRCDKQSKRICATSRCCVKDVTGAEAGTKEQVSAKQLPCCLSIRMSWTLSVVLNAGFRGWPKL